MTEPRDDAHVDELVPEYLSGRLDAAQDARVREHLVTCASCRSEATGLEPITTALRHLDPDDLLPRVPEALDARVAAVLDSDSGANPAAASKIATWQQRLLLPAAAALVGAVAAGSIVAAVNNQDRDAPVAEGPVTEPVAIVAQADGIDAAAELVDHTWGLEIDLRGTGFTNGVRYRVMVVDRRGVVHPSGAFVGVGAVEMDCALSSAVLRADAVAFRVVGNGGRTVLRADLDV